MTNPIPNHYPLKPNRNLSKVADHLKHLLKTRIFPKYGESGYFGLESNPMTRGMYARCGIGAVRVTDQELMMLPGADQS